MLLSTSSSNILDQSPTQINLHYFNFDVTATNNMVQSSYPKPMPMVVSQAGSFRKPSTKKRRYRKDRRVSFGPDVILAYIETSCEITQKEKDNCWYQSIELEAMKKSAKSLCQARISNNIVNFKKAGEGVENNYCSDQNQDQEEEDDDDSLRGLGAYYPSRVRYCKKYIKHVLEAYHSKFGPGDEEHVAFFATKWSTKNRQRAIESGMKDFYIAYEIPKQNQEQKTLPAAA